MDGGGGGIEAVEAKHGEEVRDSMPGSVRFVTRGAQDACLPGRLESVFETSISTLLK